MLIILSQKIDTESTYSDQLFSKYNFPASLRKGIHEGDTFVYYQGNKKVKAQRYYFGTGRIGKITQAEDGRFDAVLLKVKKFKNTVPIYYSEGKNYIESLDYETVRKSKTPPWQTSIRPISQKAFDCIISRAGSLLDVKKEDTVEELKEKLKDAIRHFFSGNDPAIMDLSDIAAEIRNKLYPKEQELMHETSAFIRAGTASLSGKGKEFADYCRSTKMSYSYKMLLMLCFFQHADNNGRLHIDKAVEFFRSFFSDRRAKGLIVELKPCIYHDADIADDKIRKNLIANPIKVLTGSCFFIWDKEACILEMERKTWNSIYPDAVKYMRHICEQRLSEYYKNG